MARTAPPRSSLIRALGISGWDGADAVVLAALATEAPLLLIGPHGSAKSLLLTRLADALGLAHRHYNASLLSFDDLVGFPVPQGDRLVYLQTPATIWDAEAVFFDEVSRSAPSCRTSSSRSSTSAWCRACPDLREALGNVKTLTGLLPVCAWCKKIRDDAGYWERIEAYLSRHTDAQFTHGICPDCLARMRWDDDEGTP